MLKSLYQRHKERLEIVTISIDNDFNLFLNYVLENNYDWQFLHYGNQSSVLSEYDVRALPTYFLIDPEGKLSISPAPSPSENIEKYLFEIMRDNNDL